MGSRANLRQCEPFGTGLGGDLGLGLKMVRLRVRVRVRVRVRADARVMKRHL